MLCVPGQRNRILAVALKKIRWSSTYSSETQPFFFAYLILVGPGLVLGKGSLPWISPKILLLLLCASNYSVVNPDLGKPILANGNLYSNICSHLHKQDRRLHTSIMSFVSLNSHIRNDSIYSNDYCCSIRYVFVWYFCVFVQCFGAPNTPLELV